MARPVQRSISVEPRLWCRPGEALRVRRRGLGEAAPYLRHREHRALAGIAPSGEDAELAPLEWVRWFNNHRLLTPLGDVPPAEYEEQYHARHAAPTAGS